MSRIIKMPTKYHQGDYDAWDISVNARRKLIFGLSSQCLPKNQFEFFQFFPAI